MGFVEIYPINPFHLSYVRIFIVQVANKLNGINK